MATTLTLTQMLSLTLSPTLSLTLTSTLTQVLPLTEILAWPCLCDPICGVQGHGDGPGLLGAPRLIQVGEAAEDQILTMFRVTEKARTDRASGQNIL